MKLLRLVFIIAFSLFINFYANAQDYFLAKYGPYDNSIPTPAEFLGYGIGEYHTRHDKIVAYLDKLASLSDRASIARYGKTHELRELVMLTVTTSANLTQLGVSSHELGDKQFYTGRGCDHCADSGYRGRKGLFELLDVTDPLRELIIERAPSVVLKQKAIELGMNTLRENGLSSIYSGETTIEEVLKYT